MRRPLFFLQKCLLLSLSFMIVNPKLIGNTTAYNLKKSYKALSGGGFNILVIFSIYFIA